MIGYLKKQKEIVIVSSVSISSIGLWGAIALLREKILYLIKVIVFIFPLLILSEEGTSVRDIKTMIAVEATLLAIPVQLALAIASTESSFRPLVVGDKGKAIGLFQLHYNTAHHMGYRGKRRDLFNIKNNIKYGLRFLRYRLSKCSNYLRGISSYNTGNCRTYSTKYMRKIFKQIYLYERRKECRTE